MRVTSQRLKRLAESERFVRFVRPFPGEPEIDGFVVAVGEELVVIEEFFRLRFQAFRILARDQIVDIRPSSALRTAGRIIAAEHMRRGFDPGCNVHLRSWRSLMAGLGESERAVIVEGETADADDDLFAVGKIVSTREVFFKLLEFDACGRWEKRATRIPYERITSVHVDSHYATTFARHLR